MKVWRGYGSEHSASIVMIGEFKSVEEAESVYALIEELSGQASDDYSDDIISDWSKNERYSDKTEDRIRQRSLHYLSPSDIADFALNQPNIEKKGKELHFWTDDVEIGGFIKLMVNKGAKVQVYSAHNYPGDEEE